MTLYPVILAGGSGTRLWPLSREFHPKQFLSLTGERSMLQETAIRLDGHAGVAPPIIVCNEAHRFLVAEQMREVDRRPLAIIVEPVGRGTAPALTLASVKLGELAAPGERDPVMIAMPADHLIRDVEAFGAVVRVGESLAQSGDVVTFGVVPNAPATGYGYIRMGRAIRAAGGDKGNAGPSSGGRGRVKTDGSPGGGYRIASFVEKPERKVAQEYIDTGEYLWNSGIFMMRPSVWLSELDQGRPDILKSCKAAAANAHIDGEFIRPSAADFVACPNDTIDYAVMEKAAGDQQGKSSRRSQAAAQDRADYAVVPLDAGWSDIGAWTALAEATEGDSEGNVVQGDVYAHSTKNALLIAQQRLLATIGIEDVVVVETRDAVLVAHKDRVQEVRDVVERLKADGRTEHETQSKVHRPWGSYEVLDAGEGFQVKRLTINPGASLSKQMHHHRAEHWVVVRGTARVTKGDEVFLLSENQSTYVDKETHHRLENPGEGPLEIVEIQTGSYLGEDDIVRFDDDYGRHTDG